MDSPAPPDLRQADASVSPPPRRRAALEAAGAAAFAVLLVLAVVFERLAANGVIVIGFLSIFLAYLVAPVVERIRRLPALRRRGRPGPRSVSIAIVYAGLLAIGLPVWIGLAPRVGRPLWQLARSVPLHIDIFLGVVRVSERWHERFAFSGPTRDVLGVATRRLSVAVQGQVREVAGELVNLRALVPWLALVPVVAFLLLSRWPAFRRSTLRVLPNAHLQWRGDEFFRHVNSVVAAYTRAQATSGLIVVFLCAMGFALLGVPHAGSLGILAGLFEFVPLVGPLAIAVIATTTVTGERALVVLAFLAGTRVMQDYLIYPRLISRRMHLHPLAVIVALWVGATVGGIIGVCLAIPSVGVVKVTVRHWREYRDIERLVREHDARQATPAN